MFPYSFYQNISLLQMFFHLSFWLEYHQAFDVEFAKDYWHYLMKIIYSHSYLLLFLQTKKVVRFYSNHLLILCTATYCNSVNSQWPFFLSQHTYSFIYLVMVFSLTPNIIAISLRLTLLSSLIIPLIMFSISSRDIRETSWGTFRGTLSPPTFWVAIFLRGIIVLNISPSSNNGFYSE